jgi:hypothetical protein
MILYIGFKIILKTSMDVAASTFEAYASNPYVRTSSIEKSLLRSLWHLCTNQKDDDYLAAASCL